jgi:hypothetical protein
LDSVIKVIQTPEPGTLITGSSQEVTLLVTEEGEELSRFTINVEIVDSKAPVITSTHEDEMIALNSFCNATMPDYTDSVTTMDDCDTNIIGLNRCAVAE